MVDLLSRFEFRDLTLKNRIVISPMCQYSAVDGFAQDWHFAHYGRLTLGRPAMIILEATSVTPNGRLSYGDLGIWCDDQITGLARIASFMHSQGVVAAIQLGHAGRKACTQRPWHGMGPVTDEDIALRDEAPWGLDSVGGEPHEPHYQSPVALTPEKIESLIQAWKDAARRSLAAGFEVVEVHAAHGYLLHSFLSPLSNTRTDEFGGSFENRIRFSLMVAEAVREIWPSSLPVMFRISSRDADERGWSLDDSALFAVELKKRGVDAIDCSSGGIGSSSTLSPRRPGFQVPYAEFVRRKADVVTIAVGLIMDVGLANDVICKGQADLVAIGREALSNPNWPLDAVLELTGNVGFDSWPEQYGWWLKRRARSLRDAKVR